MLKYIYVKKIYIYIYIYTHVKIYIHIYIQQHYIVGANVVIVLFFFDEKYCFCFDKPGTRPGCSLEVSHKVSNRSL